MPRKNHKAASVQLPVERKEARRRLEIAFTPHAPSVHLLNLRREVFPWQELDHSQQKTAAASVPQETLKHTEVTMRRPAIQKAPAFKPMPVAATPSPQLHRAPSAEENPARRRMYTTTALGTPGYTLKLMRRALRIWGGLVPGALQTATSIMQILVRSFRLHEIEWRRGAVSFIVLSTVFMTPIHAFSFVEKTTNIQEEVAPKLIAQLQRPQAFTRENLKTILQSLQELSATARRLRAITRPLARLTPHLSKKISLGSTAIAVADDFQGALSIIDRVLSDPAYGAMKPTEKIAAMVPAISAALPGFDRAAAGIGILKENDIPAEYQELFKAAQYAVQSTAHDARALATNAETILEALGSRLTQRYLVVFQNINELRPTGGFIGSFALMDIDRGEIKNIEVPGGGSYDLQGQQRAAVVAPPQMRLVNPRWEFQDANWFPDFAVSAQKLAWFYRQGGGPSVDGVIAINSSLLPMILHEIGPLALPGYGLTLSEENVIEEVQNQVELLYDKKENRPKKLLADLTPIIIERIKNADNAAKARLMTMLMAALNNREIQLWSAHAQMQSVAENFGWAGRLATTPLDYLAVVHTNIGSQKTDAVMITAVEHTVRIMSDGTIEDAVTITRTHTGDKNEHFMADPNRDYIRLYVPAGAVLISAANFTPPDESLFKGPETWLREDEALAREEADGEFERASGTWIGRESGKTVFGNWIITNPGETRAGTFTYRLPFRAFMPGENGGKLGLTRPAFLYTVLTQKQSGARVAAHITRIILPEGFAPAWSTEEFAAHTSGSITTDGALSGDRFWGVVAAR